MLDGLQATQSVATEQLRVGDYIVGRGGRRRVVTRTAETRAGTGWYDVTTRSLASLALSRNCYPAGTLWTVER